MVPYLHFTGGDNLFLAVWAPTSRGDIAAACIGLLLLAMVERWLAAVRMVFDHHWHKRAMALVAASEQPLPLASVHKSKAKVLDPGSETQDSDEKLSPTPPYVNEIRVESRNTTLLAPPMPTNPPRPPRMPSLRTIPPFIAEHDIPRGILFAFQMFLGYLLMLAVMTFQAAYLISIILGLGIGEAVFGRVSRLSSSH